MKPECYNWHAGQRVCLVSAVTPSTVLGTVVRVYQASQGADDASYLEVSFDPATPLRRFDIRGNDCAGGPSIQPVQGEPVLQGNFQRIRDTKNQQRVALAEQMRGKRLDCIHSTNWDSVPNATVDAIWVLLQGCANGTI